MENPKNSQLDHSQAAIQKYIDDLNYYGRTLEGVDPKLSWILRKARELAFHQMTGNSYYEQKLYLKTFDGKEVLDDAIRIHNNGNAVFTGQRNDDSALNQLNHSQETIQKYINAVNSYGRQFESTDPKLTWILRTASDLAHHQMTGNSYYKRKLDPKNAKTISGEGAFNDALRIHNKGNAIFSRYCDTNFSRPGGVKK